MGHRSVLFVPADGEDGDVRLPHHLVLSTTVLYVHIAHRTFLGDEAGALISWLLKLS